MAQATRCPHCQSAFRVVRDQLLLRQGWVRCGHCGQAFNALDHLFDLPAERPKPPAAAPVSAGREDASARAMTAAASGAAAASSAAATAPPPAAPAPATPPAVTQPASPAASALVWDDTPEPAAAPSPLASPPESSAPLLPLTEQPTEPPSSPDSLASPDVTLLDPATNRGSRGWTAPPVEPIHVPALVPLESMPTLDDLPDGGVESAPPAPEWIADPDETPLTAAVSAAWLDGEPAAGPDASRGAPDDQQARAEAAPVQPSSATPEPAAVPPAPNAGEHAPFAGAPDIAAALAGAPAGHAGSDASAETAPADLPSLQSADASEPPIAQAPAEPAPAPAEADDADPLTRLDLADALHYQFAPEDAVAATAAAASAGRAAEPEFLRRDRALAFWRSTPVRLTLAVLALLLALLAAAQAAWFWRDDLAQRWPATRPWLQRLCDATTGCLIGAPRDLQALVIDASSLTPAEPPPGLRLHVLLRNQSVDRAVAWPALELTLLDLQGQIRARKVLLPAQYLPPARATPQALAAGIAAGEQVSVEVRLLAQGEAPAGYRVLAFYP